MQVKTISYKRVLNLGNYENKHLELFAEVLEGEDEEEAISRLAEMVERKIREQAGKEFNKEILKLEATRNNLFDEIAALKDELKRLGKIKDEPPIQEADPDDIPFKGGDPTDSF